MRNNLVVAISVASIAILASCGTSKKLEQTTTELNQLKEANALQTQKISAYESDIKKLKEENIVYGKEAQDCRLLEESLRKNLEAINGALAEQGTSLRQLEAKIDESLEKFADAGVDVTYKNGLVHISLQDQLIFNSGSATVGWEGKQALELVAKEFNQFPNTTMYVVGNTDNAKVKSGYKDNWSLSTERANAVVRVLRDDYHVDPARLISAGRAMYNPIAENETEGGKARNRRTEIIINPNLERLWEMGAK
jgi:chemotaxis protein MotB